MPPVSILGIVGSLRAGSWNLRLLEAARDASADLAEVRIWTPHLLPLFNQDLEPDLPPAVRAFRQRVELADAVLFATPQYNGSIPGVVATVLDWGFRPAGSGVLRGKIVGIVGATTGASATRGAREALRTRLSRARVVEASMGVPHVASLTDDRGTIVDPATRAELRRVVAALVAAVEADRRPAPALVPA